MMILDPKSTFSETIPKFLEIEKFMKILKISKSQGKWALFQWIFEISKKNSSFSFEIPNKSKSTYKTNEKSTFFQNESFLGKTSKTQEKWRANHDRKSHKNHESIDTFW